MGDCDFHRARSAEALLAAQALRADHPGWALVPLFYSAMHAMHFAFARDMIPEDQRHPEQHKTHYSNGRLVAWGTLDVVRNQYMPTVSRAYGSLFSASTATRYGMPVLGDGARFWQDYETIRAFIEQS